jgi:hypothetical protein
MEVLEKTCHKYNPGFPFRYTFADQTFGRLYQSEMVMKQLAWYFAALAMLIACLGLLGLATFTARQRQKEIGIRKVLGASVIQVVILLAGDFLSWYCWPWPLPSLCLVRDAPVVGELCLPGTTGMVAVCPGRPGRPAGCLRDGKFAGHPGRTGQPA